MESITYVKTIHIYIKRERKMSKLCVLIDCVFARDYATVGDLKQIFAQKLCFATNTFAGYWKRICALYDQHIPAGSILYVVTKCFS